MAKDLENLKLLLVDDEDDFRLATSTTLKRRGFEVEEAANGEEALACIKQKRPDIVLLDMKMPGMSGIETLKEIRAIDANLPVIILTGHGDYDSAMAGIKLEIVDFLQKPVDVDQLGHDVIVDLLARALLGRRSSQRVILCHQRDVPPEVDPVPVAQSAQQSRLGAVPMDLVAQVGVPPRRQLLVGRLAQELVHESYLVEDPGVHHLNELIR